MAIYPSLPLLLGTLLLASVAAASSYSGYIDYNTSSGIVPDKLNVHLVPHSHDDVGWLKTVDQYFVGLNNSIQGACVQNVLDSVVDALLADRNRKFIFVEQAFFQRWWRLQSQSTKNQVRNLVQRGQLEFINGGWCMHDEAAVHYVDMIDQTTLGHRYIKEQFDLMPRIGWQIDPFGHSSVQAYLLSTEVGFDALYFSRIDYQDRAKRINTRSLEVVWRGSKSLDSSSDVFTGIFPKNYEPPPGGFYFEVNDDSPVIQDDPLLFDYNVQERVDDFVTAALAQAKFTRTNHIMFTMGTDFKYQYAKTWYRQMDKFIHYVNKDGRVNAFYSTPSIYTDAKHAANEDWPLKTGDFFPYADRINAYWTGYFTSRPALKGYVRFLSGYSLAARQLEFLRSYNSTDVNTNSLLDALAIAQHHDAVAGTEKQHVANDYANRLSIGYTEAEKLVSLSLDYLATYQPHSRWPVRQTKFKQCPLLNLTYCPSSEADLSSGKDLVLLVYNSLGWKRVDVLRIPVSIESVVVKDDQGREIEAQLTPISNVTLNLRNSYVKAYTGMAPATTPKYWLAFPVTLPPLGYSTYTISTGDKLGSKVAISSVHLSQDSSNTTEVGQGSLKLIYDTRSNSLVKYANSKSSVNADIGQSFSYYRGSEADDQASGAYIFRPDGSVSLAETQGNLKIFRGPILDEVHQKICEWIYQVTRVFKEKEYVEVEFMVGPIPIDDSVGKEVITKFVTTIKSNKIFYTDSNGRDFLKRVRDYRPDWDLKVNQPVSGNYYPINLGIYIEDGTTELSVLVDRAVGGSSIQDGQLELMLHRRLLYDDGRGVAESLNEEVCIDGHCAGLIVQGKVYFRIDSSGKGAKWRRSMGQEIYAPLLVAFSEQDGERWTKTHVTNFSLCDPSYTLPENVALITLQALENGRVLLRLAHLYEVGEDKDLSEIAKVDLKKLFGGREISNIVEMSLTANQKRNDMEKKRLKWNVEGTQSAPNTVRGGPVDESRLIVELAPMEIRTFLLHVHRRPHHLGRSSC